MKMLFNILIVLSMFLVQSGINLVYADDGADVFTNLGNIGTIDFSGRTIGRPKNAFQSISSSSACAEIHTCQGCVPSCPAGSNVYVYGIWNGITYWTCFTPPATTGTTTPTTGTTTTPTGTTTPTTSP